MKSTNLLFVMAICSIAFITSCKKTNSAGTVEEIETTFDLSGKQAIADNLTQDDNDIVDEVTATNSLNGSYALGPITVNNLLGACAVVTVTGSFLQKISALILEPDVPMVLV